MYSDEDATQSQKEKQSFDEKMYDADSLSDVEDWKDEDVGNDEQYANVTKGNRRLSESEYEEKRKVLQREMRLLLVMTATMLIATFTMVPSFPFLNRYPHSTPEQEPLEDQCLKVFNTSILELLEEASKFTERGDKEWCYARHKDNCHCTPPTIASAQIWEGRGNMMEQWNHTFERNKDLVTNASGNYDIVFYGDSITEHWWGTDLAHERTPWLAINQLFQQYFNKSSGASLNGLPLGIGGDRCAQLLYRIQNGELPDTLNPKLFWLNIGTNDFADYCQAESLAAGNIRIAQELLSRRPDATVVINSILPRGNPEMPLSDKKKDWPEVQRLNQWLKCYADSTRGVEFFNATSLFVESSFLESSNDTTAHQVEEYYKDDVHPNDKGSVGWAKAIVERANELMGKHIRHR